MKPDFGSIFIGQTGLDFASMAGTGTDLLLSGTAAQVNRSLAALDYTSSVPGSSSIHVLATNDNGAIWQSLTAGFAVSAHG